MQWEKSSCMYLEGSCIQEMLVWQSGSWQIVHMSAEMWKEWRFYSKVCLGESKTIKEEGESYLREQIIHSLLNQWIKIIHGVARGSDQGVLVIPTLQIHNPVLHVSCVNAQKNAKGDGRHWA